MAQLTNFPLAKGISDYFVGGVRSDLESETAFFHLRHSLGNVEEIFLVFHENFRCVELAGFWIRCSPEVVPIVDDVLCAQLQITVDQMAQSFDGFRLFLQRSAHDRSRVELEDEKAEDENEE